MVKQTNPKQTQNLRIRGYKATVLQHLCHDETQKARDVGKARDSLVMELFHLTVRTGDGHGPLWSITLPETYTTARHSHLVAGDADSGYPSV